jgi:protein TonB
MRLLEKPIILVFAIAVNSLLFLLIPIVQVMFGNPPMRVRKQEKRVAPLETIIKKQPQKQIKKEYKAIKSYSRRFKPSTPGARSVKMDLSVVSGGEGVAIEAGELGVLTYLPGETDTDVEIIKEKPLKMPLRARREEISGYVDLVFVVNEAGFPGEIQVLIENPAGYGFTKSAIKALKSMRFRPATIKNVPVRQKCKRRFRFDVE